MSLRKLAGAFVAIAVVGVAAFSGDATAAPKVGRLGEVALEGVSAKELDNLGLSPPARNYVPSISASEAKNATSHSEKRVAVKQILDHQL